MLPKFSIEASRLTITFRLRHLAGRRAQVDADDRRQELGGQADGQRRGEQEGVQGRPPQGDVDGEDDEDQDERDLHEEVAEPADPALEFGLGPARGPSGPRRGRTRSPRPVWTARAVAVPLTTWVPRKRQLLRRPSAVPSGSGPGAFSTGIGLPGQGRLVDDGGPWTPGPGSRPG